MTELRFHLIVVPPLLISVAALSFYALMIA